ncbi:uncharacterized protein [Haliotis cracherodii]|uniref:uncharacterized protein n=1 Tax=Haliotis cracherodii TaxID=6455 RepID=UPI0039EC06F6
MNMKLCVAAIVVCFGLSEAFLWERRTATASGETDPQCFAHGSAGRCEFYSCFENRLSCGSRGYMSKYGGYYCARFAELYNTFDQQAKDWINATSRCMTERLLAYYNQETVQCHDLSHFAWNNWSACYLENGFCEVFWANRQAFWDIYQFRDLFSMGAGKIWREMMQITGQCAAQRGSAEFTQRGGFQGMIDNIRNLGDRIRNTVSKK